MVNYLFQENVSLNFKKIHLSFKEYLYQTQIIFIYFSDLYCSLKIFLFMEINISEILKDIGKVKYYSILNGINNSNSIFPLSLEFYY